MDSRNEKFLRQWERTRKMGKTRYALSRGFIAGLILFLFTGLYNLWEKPFADVFLSLRGCMVFLFWICGAIITYGAAVWPINESHFRKKAEEAE